MKTVVEKLFENAQLHPDKLAVVFENEEVTYGELRDAVTRLASWFKLHGVQEGDRVLAQANHSKWFIAAYFAVHLCGAIIVPLEKRLTQETLQGVIERMQAKAVVSWLAPAAEVSLNYADIERELQDVAEQPLAFPSEESAAVILSTSGTTGAPKGVVLSQRNIAVIAQAIVRDYQFQEDDVGITFSPISHAGVLRRLDPAIYNGSTYIFLDGFVKIKLLFAFIEKYHVTTISTPPSGITLIEQMSQDRLSRFADWIQAVIVSTSAIQEPQRDFLRKVLPKSRIVYIYSSSEAGHVSFIDLSKETKEISCVGKLCSGVEVKILSDGREVGRGELGRIAVRSDEVFMGYYHMPELTQELFRDGFFLTNDVGDLDEEGYLYLVGRMDDLINVGGLKLYPSEVENAANEIDGVEECICFDIPSKTTGKAVKLLIRKKEESGLDAKTVRKVLSEKIDAYKVPSSIEFVREIAKNANGKPNRKYYRESNLQADAEDAN